MDPNRRLLCGRRHCFPGRLAAMTLGLLLLLPVGGAAQENPRHRFLMIYSDHSGLPAYQDAGAGVEAALRPALSNGYEVFAEFRDGQRFPGAQADRLFAEEMRRKYGDQPFDAILAFGQWALLYAITHRDEFPGSPPVVFGGAPSDTVELEHLPQNFHGFANAYPIADTLRLARQLQPRATRAVLMAGSSPFDRAWREKADAATAEVPGLQIDFVSDLTLGEFRALAAGLDRDTILLVLTIFQDAAGERFTPARAAAQIAEVSAAPVYAVHSTFIGDGVVGGAVESFTRTGDGMAKMALRLMDGSVDEAKLSYMPPVPTVDWRQVRRFGLDPAHLPQETVLLFHEVSVWERYRPQIGLALILFLAQSLTITALVLQKRRRMAAEIEATQRRSELAHMSRVTQLGELSGALAHELSQPLTSILANAEAGVQLLGREHPDLEEIAAILEDIAEDDRRAAGIIRDLRQLMSKGEAEFVPLDLNELMEASLRLLGSELVARRVIVETHSHPGSLTVRGSRVQLKQVIINFLMNAAEAVADQSPEQRLIRVETRLRNDGWRELAVLDQGVGVPQELVDPFLPFATTKTGGLGLGLSICRTIAGAHGGNVGFDTGVAQGARIVLALPPPEAS